MHDVRTFDRFAAAYDRLMPAADPATLRAALDLAVEPVEVVVDLGGGTGRAGRAIRDDVVVVDPAAGMVRGASRHGLATVTGVAEHVPLRSDSVDAILIVDALHHFESPETALHCAADAVRPGGVVVVRDFDPRTLRGRALVGLEHVVGFDSRFLDRDQLHAALADAGLDVHVVDTGFAMTVAGVKPKSTNERVPTGSGR